MRLNFFRGAALIATLCPMAAQAGPLPLREDLDAGFIQLMGDFGRRADTILRDVAPDGSGASYQFSDGTRLTVRRSDREPGKVSINGLVGTGRLGLPAKLAQSAWSMAFMPLGGTTAATYEEIEHWLAASGHSVELNFNPELRASRFWGTAAAPDIGYQLALLCGISRHPGMREVVAKKAAEFGSTLALQIEMNPQIVLARAVGRAASGLGARYDEFPLPSEISQDLSKEILAISERELGGPMDLAVVGDVDPDDAASYVAQTCAAGARSSPPRQAPVLVGHFEGGEHRWTFIASEKSEVNGLEALVWPIAEFGSDERHRHALDDLAQVLRIRLSQRLSSPARRVVSIAAISQGHPTDRFGFFALAVENTSLEASKLRDSIDRELRALAIDPGLDAQVSAVAKARDNDPTARLSSNLQFAEALAEGPSNPVAVARVALANSSSPESTNRGVREAAFWLLKRKRPALISINPRR